MNKAETSVTTDQAASRFESLESLRDAHNDLLRRRRFFSEDSVEFMEEVKSFIRRGQATGVLLETDAERSDTQNLLNYWYNILYRAGHQPPDTTLSEFDPTLEPELPDDAYPYPGLDAFQEEKNYLFFGWQRLIKECLEKLRENRLLAIIGPTGSGRSSLVWSGLLPALKAGRLPGSETWRYDLMMVPGADPLSNLARLVRPRDIQDADWTEQQVRRFQQDPGHLVRLLRESGDQPAVVVVDQFEQLFTQCDKPQRQAFVDNLLGVVQRPDSHDAVVLIMRSDQVSYLGQLEGLQPLFQRGQVFMAFTTAELRQAIEEPAKRVGLKFDEGVVDRLLLDIQGDPASLALLQFTLLKLWEHREGNRITWDTYSRVGGGRLALERSAEAFYKGLTIEERETAKRILLLMVRPDAGRETMCSSVRRRLLYQAGTQYQIDRVLDLLLQNGLVRRVQSAGPRRSLFPFRPWSLPDPREGRMESVDDDDAQFAVAHEALISHWPRLIEWLDEERLSRRQRLRLSTAAEQWRDKGKDPGALWRGSLLAEAQGYQDRNDLEEEFVQASEKAESKAATRRLWLFSAAIAALVAIAGLLIAMVQLRSAVALAAEAARAHAAEDRAGEEAQQKRGAKALAEEKSKAVVKMLVKDGVRRLETGDLSSSLAYFDEARNQDMDDQVRSNIHRLRLGAALWQLPKLAQLWHLESLPEAEVRQADTLQKGMNAAEFSPTGNLVVTASGELGGKKGWAQVWDARTGALVKQFDQDTGPVSDAMFNRDESLVVTISGEPGGKTGEARIWNVKTGQNLKTLSHGNGAVNHAEFSRDSNHLVTASGVPGGSIGETQVWDISDVKNGEATCVQTLPHTGEVAYAAFSPDGRRVVTALREASGDTGKAQVWDVEHRKTEPVLTLECKSAVNHATFSPDGDFVLTASGRQGTSQGKAQMWDVKNLKRTPILNLQHDDAVTYGAFSPDGTLLVTASHDATARVWRVKDGTRLLTLNHGSSVFHASFSPDARRLATASRDSTVRVWDVTTGELIMPPLNHSGTVSRVSFSPEGLRLLTSSLDTARVWEMATGNPAPMVLTEVGAVNHVSLRPDARYLITINRRGRGGGEVRAWKVDTAGTRGESLAVRVDSRVKCAAVSPDSDSRFVLTISGESSGDQDEPSGDPRKVHIRDRNTATDEPLTLEASGVVNHAAFSPDGRLVVVASGQLLGDSGQAEVWKLVEEEAKVKWTKVAQLVGHKGGVIHAEFSRDGRVVTASADDSAKVWTATGHPVWSTNDKPEDRHTADVTHASFSRDSTRVVTASYDGTARIWDAKTGKKLATLSHGGKSLKRAAFSPDGHLVLTLSHSGTVWVWDVATKSLVTILKHGAAVEDACFGPDGDKVVAVGFNSPGGMGERLMGEALQPMQSGDGERSASLRGQAPRHDGEAIPRQVRMRVWNVSPYIDDLADQQLYHQLVSTRKIDHDFVDAPIESRDLAGHWKRLKEKHPHPDDFPFKVQPALHKREADECEANEEWFAAAWHLQRIVEVEKENLSYIDRLAQAYGRSGQWSEAAQAYLKASELEPINWRWWAKRARALAEQGHWNEAASDFSKAIDLQATNDFSKAIGSELKMEDVWYHGALVQLVVGDEDGYGTTCAGMLKHFEGTDNARVSNQVAWTCLLSPRSGIDPSQIVEWAKEAVERDPMDYYYLNTLGVALYRAGYFNEAVEQLDKAMKAYSNPLVGEAQREQTGGGTFWDWIFLAMANHRRGQPETGRQWLDQTVQWIENYVEENPKNRSVVGPPLRWSDRQEMLLLRREAEQVLNAGR